MFIPICDLLQKEFHFDISAVLGDGIYDTSAILKYVMNTLQAKPRIARNPRNTQDQPERKISKSGNPFCDASLLIKSHQFLILESIADSGRMGE